MAVELSDDEMLGVQVTMAVDTSSMEVYPDVRERDDSSWVCDSFTERWSLGRIEEPCPDCEIVAVLERNIMDPETAEVLAVLDAAGRNPSRSTFTTTSAAERSSSSYDGRIRPRIADTLDETCHGLREIVDRVDDGEAENHLKLAISHLEHVARWDRDERGETPTDALRDFVTDGGVDQSDGETDHSGREPEDTEAADQVLREALGDDLPDGFLDDEEENERSGDATRTDGGVDCHELTPSDDADLPRTNAETQLPRFVSSTASSDDDDVLRRHRRERRAAVPRHGRHDDRPRLLAYDAVIHAGRRQPEYHDALVQRAVRDDRPVSPHGRPESVVPGRPDSRRAGDHAGGGQPCLNRRRVRPACSTSTASRRG